MNLANAQHRSLYPAYLLVTGLCMGAADVVPGVSGGTMALIMGIYEPLLLAIQSFDTTFLQLAVRGQIRQAMNRVPWSFLVPLVCGILLALISLAELISVLLDHHERLLFAFFFGLIVGSILVLVIRQNWNVALGLGLVVGAAVAYAVVGLVPAAPGHHPILLFASGTLAICAMILPGISGSFILLILGQYEFCVETLSGLVHALAALDLPLAFHLAFWRVLPLGLGAASGLVLFSRVLNWLLHNFPSLTMSVLIGFMIGSLRRIWPYKQYTLWGEDRHGERIPLQWRNQLPESFSWEVAAALGLALVGLILIVVLDMLRHRFTPPHRKQDQRR